MAKGSENKLAPYPGVCCVCGESLRFSKSVEAIWFGCRGPSWKLESWHWRCAPLLAQNGAAPKEGTAP